MTQAAYEAARQMRESMCSSLLKMVTIQDVSAGVVSSRAASVASIMADAAQVTSVAVSGCTKVLVTTLLENPHLAGAMGTSQSYANAVSSLLELGMALTPDVAALLTSAVCTLNAGMQANMVVGQADQAIVTKNLRFSTSIANTVALSRRPMEHREIP
jgi:hypothetical protein